MAPHLPHLPLGPLYLSLAAVVAVASARFSIDSRGYFRNESKLFVPVGVNYWPRSTGSNLWNWPGTFPEEEISNDFHVLARDGFNAIRVFPLFPSFEPAAGEFNVTAFGTLARMMQLAADHGLSVTLSAITGGMSGRKYWPDWLNGSSIYTDPKAFAATRAYAVKLGQTVAPFVDSLLSIDLGNEDNGLDTQDPTLTATEVVTWTQAIYDALHEGCGCSAPIVPGTGDNAYLGDSVWPYSPPGSGVPRVAGDTLNSHNYPVLFVPLKPDGLTDPLTHSGALYNLAFVRSLGPTFMQEWGTLVTGGTAQQDTYLRQIIPRAWAHGVNGFIWWMMRDVDEANGAVDELPYRTHGKESLLGIYNGSSDNIKPGLGFLAEFAQTVAAAAVAPPLLPEDDPDAVALYVPKHFYIKADPANAGNDPSAVVIDGALAYHSLLRLNRSVYVIRGGTPLIGKRLRTLVLNGALLDAEELQHLQQWVEAGGRLLWQGVSPRSGFDAGGIGGVAGALLGARCTGTIEAPALQVRFGGALWNMTTSWRVPEHEWPPKPAGWPGPPTAARLEQTGDPRSQRVWTEEVSGAVVALRNTMGSGAVLGVVPPVTASIDVLPSGASRDRWHRWFAAAVACAESVAGCADPNKSNSKLYNSGADAPGPGPVPGPTPVPPAARMPRRTAAPVAIGVYAGGSSKATAVAAAAAITAVGHTAVPLASPLNASTFAGLEAVVVPSQELVDLHDQALMSTFVHDGPGCLLWHGYYPATFSTRANDMLGAAAVDFRSALPATFSAFGRTWTMSGFKRSKWAVRGELSTESPHRPTWGTAKVLARDSNGLAAVLTNRWGGGTTVAVTAAVEVAVLGAELAAFYGEELATLCGLR